MDDLNDDFLWHLFLRLDFLEPENTRRTSPRFEALVVEDAFLRAYHREGRGSVWNFMHLYNNEDPLENLVVGQREEDGAMVNYIFHMDDFEAELTDEEFIDIHMIGAFRNILIFASLHGTHWFLLYNLVTRASRVAHLPYPNALELIVLELGIRIIEDPQDPLNYIFFFAFPAFDTDRGDTQVDYFTFSSNPHNPLLPPAGRATVTHHLTAQEMRHPSYMFISELEDDNEDDIARFLSIRNTHPSAPPVAKYLDGYQLGTPHYHPVYSNSATN